MLVGPADVCLLLDSASPAVLQSATCTCSVCGCLEARGCCGGDGGGRGASCVRPDSASSGLQDRGGYNTGKGGLVPQ